MDYYTIEVVIVDMVAYHLKLGEFEYNELLCIWISKLF